MKAEQVARQWVKVRPSAQAYQALIYTLNNLGAYPVALEVALEAVGKYPNDAVCLKWLATIYRRSNMHDKAIETAQLYVEKFPNRGRSIM